MTVSPRQRPLGSSPLSDTCTHAHTRANTHTHTQWHLDVPCLLHPLDQLIDQDSGLYLNQFSIS